MIKLIEELYEYNLKKCSTHGIVELKMKFSFRNDSQKYGNERKQGMNVKQRKW